MVSSGAGRSTCVRCARTRPGGLGLSSSTVFFCCPFQRANAGCEQLHHLHQKQHPLPALRRHQVGFTSTPNLRDPRPETHFVSGLRGNFPSTMTSEQIKKCNYHPEKNPFCPIFRVGDVLNYTGQEIADLADKVRPLFSDLRLHQRNFSSSSSVLSFNFMS